MVGQVVVALAGVSMCALLIYWKETSSPREGEQVGAPFLPEEGTRGPVEVEVVAVSSIKQRDPPLLRALLRRDWRGAGTSSVRQRISATTRIRRPVKLLNTLGR